MDEEKMRTLAREAIATLINQSSPNPIQDALRKAYAQGKYDKHTELRNMLRPYEADHIIAKVVKDLIELAGREE